MLFFVFLKSVKTIFLPKLPNFPRQDTLWTPPARFFEGQGLTLEKHSPDSPPNTTGAGLHDMDRAFLQISQPIMLSYLEVCWDVLRNHDDPSATEVDWSYLGSCCDVDNFLSVPCVWAFFPPLNHPSVSAGFVVLQMSQWAAHLSQLRCANTQTGW